MKIIKIEVSCCEDCLNHNSCDNYPDEELDYCMNARDGAGKQKDIKDITKIPAWCPLPDAPKSLPTKSELTHLAKCLGHYVRMIIEIGELKPDSPVGIAYRDFIAEWDKLKKEQQCEHYPLKPGGFIKCRKCGLYL